MKTLEYSASNEDVSDYLLLSEAEKRMAGNDDSENISHEQMLKELANKEKIQYINLRQHTFYNEFLNRYLKRSIFGRFFNMALTNSKIRCIIISETKKQGNQKT